MAKNKPIQTNKPSNEKPWGHINNSVDARKVDPPPKKKK